ncbi:MAG: SDR family NAD(P)-dependent oxidoreductase [Haliea sp.]|uniref:SDR family NAD(P)-dependent oxidoreductase n=1 Tax=Haliea sp. TaxID=1932666 RepID=UPI0032EF099A
MGQLSGKTALITGASRGIGQAIATRFAAEGAAVVLCASRLGAHGDLPGTLECAVAAINASGGRAAAEVCDLLVPEARADLVARAAAHFGPIDILVNNAAGSSMDLPSRVTTAKRNLMLDLNLNVPMELAQQALPGMRERGAGWILSISSATVNQPLPPYRDSREAALVIAAYGASKAALNRYSEGLAHELAPENIFVNTLAPESIVLTPGAEYVRDIARRHPDWAEPIEMMAEAALSLCSGRHVGQMAYSRQWVLALGLSVRSLDGRTVLGDAFLPADI